MPLWSLTQERVDKVLRQIGDKETEIDTLIKLSKEDLWKRDLDDFIAEWRFQLEDEKQRQTAIAKDLKKNRRGSKKFATAATVRKQKGLDDDSDFDDTKPTKKQSKITTSFKAPQSHLVENYPKTNVFAGLSKMARKGSIDGASDDLDPDVLDNDRDHGLSKKAEPVVKPKPPKSEMGANSDAKSWSTTTAPARSIDTKTRPKHKASKADEEMPSRPAARQARAATKKPVNYGTDSDSDNGDDLLGDVSNMVKGLPAVNGDSRSFFSTSISRPGSSAGYKTASKAPSKIVDDFSADDTDYTKLVPQQSPRRSILVTAKENNFTDDEEAEEDADFNIRPALVRQPPKVAPPAQKQAKVPVVAAKAKFPAKGTKGPTAIAANEKNPQSPVAKAYAKRLAKKRVIDSDDDIDAMADDILDSPGSVDPVKEVPPPAGKANPRPARRAAAATKKATYAFDDDDEDDESADMQSAEEPTAIFSDSE